MDSNFWNKKCRVCKRERHAVSFFRKQRTRPGEKPICIVCEAKQRKN